MSESAVSDLRASKALLAFVLGMVTVAFYLIVMAAQGNNSTMETALWAAGMLIPTVLSLAAWRSTRQRLSRQLLLSATVLFFVFGALGALSVGVGFIFAGAAALYAANELPQDAGQASAVRVGDEKGQLP